METDKLLKKHAKNFVSDRQNGKLEGIHYHETGSIFVTDGHKLLVINNAHDGEVKTVHYKTNKVMPVQYPDVSRLLKNEYSGCTALDMHYLKRYMGVIKAAKNIAEDVDLTDEDGKLFLSSRNLEKESYRIEIGSVMNLPTVTLNLTYFHQMLGFFKDAGAEHVIFSWVNPRRPLSFRAGDYEIIILPMRRF